MYVDIDMVVAVLYVKIGYSLSYKEEGVCVSVVCLRMCGSVRRKRLPQEESYNILISIIISNSTSHLLTHSVTHSVICLDLLRFAKSCVDSLECLLGELSHGEASSLSVDHDGEALHVGEAGASVESGHLLGDGSGVPLLLQAESLGGLEDGGGSGTAEHVQLQLGEGESSQGVQHAGEVLAIHQHAVLVSNIDDHDELAVVLAEVHVGNSAGFHESSVDL